MGNIIKVIFFLLLLLGENSIAKDDNTKPYHIIFSDNSAILGTDGPNDLGQTGDLEVIYTDPNDKYMFFIKAELFVNGDPKDITTTRINPDNLRTDVLSMYYVQGGKFKVGFGFMIIGNMGGDHIQNIIHQISSNPHIPAYYTDTNKFTPTLNFEYHSFINDNVDFYSRLKWPIIVKNGIVEFDSRFEYSRHDNIYDLDVGTSISIGLDCSIYPDIPEFNGYPIRDFQVCVPESKFSLEYENFDIFWRIPLANLKVQNSVLGIGYKF